MSRPQAKYLFILTTQEILSPEANHGWPVRSFWEKLATSIFRVKE
jgi:hypothetical protein